MSDNADTVAPFETATSPTETVHLVRRTDPLSVNTLCGRKFTIKWWAGGNTATCERCLTIASADPHQYDG